MAFRKPQAHADALDFMDQDYMDRLDPAERAWLERFNREFYLAAASSPDNVHSPAGLRECWRQVKARQRAECVVSLGRTVDGPYMHSVASLTVNEREDMASEHINIEQYAENYNATENKVEADITKAIDCRAARAKSRGGG